MKETQIKTDTIAGSVIKAIIIFTYRSGNINNKKKKARWKLLGGFGNFSSAVCYFYFLSAIPSLGLGYVKLPDKMD